jgi:hypothetical protein
MLRKALHLEEEFPEVVPLGNSWISEVFELDRRAAKELSERREEMEEYGDEEEFMEMFHRKQQAMKEAEGLDPGGF